VIHGMHHEQDMRNYGGLRHKMPYTFWAMMIGTLAITGVGIPLTHIGFAGFLSKDAVIESAYAGTAGGYAFWMLVIAALFTSFYSWRLMFLTFFGEQRGDRHTHERAHESPMTMIVPLGVLALGAVFAGMIWYGPFFGSTEQVTEWFGDSILMVESNHVLHDAHYVSAWVKVSPFIAMGIGFLTALWFYVLDPSMPGKWAQTNRPLYLFLLNKWYFDEIYDWVFVRPTRALAELLWKRGDGDVIDGSINGVAMGLVPRLTRLAGRAQSGYIFTYVFAMVIGVAILVTWMTIFGGAN